MTFPKTDWANTDEFINIAKAIVAIYLDNAGVSQSTFEVRIVWFTKVLQNWKALVITTLPDGQYYEITYNGAKGETYVDVYQKLENFVLYDTPPGN